MSLHRCKCLDVCSSSAFLIYLPIEIEYTFPKPGCGRIEIKVFRTLNRFPKLDQVFPAWPAVLGHPNCNRHDRCSGSFLEVDDTRCEFSNGWFFFFPDLSFW